MVDHETLYFTSGTRVLSCPRGGCVNQPMQLYDSGGFDAYAVRVANDTLFYISAPNQNAERDALYACPLAGCPTPAQVVGHGGFDGVIYSDNLGDDVYYSDDDADIVFRTSCAPGFGACTGQAAVISGKTVRSRQFAAGPDKLFYIDANGVEKCPYTGCGTPVIPTLLSAQMSTAIAYYKDLVYMQFSHGNGLFGGGIRTCTPDDCDGDNPKDVIVGRQSVLSFALDGGGVYWLEQDDLQGENRLFMCSASNCVGSPKTLATGVTSPDDRTNPHMIVTDDAFIYWISGGVPMRIAKPL